MNHRQRVHATLHNAPTDRVPVALWRHFPKDDLTSEGLAARIVEFQRKFDFDMVKVTPASGYPAEMYGATFRTPDPGSPRALEGTREYVSRPVNALNDWDKIAPLDNTNFVFQREVAALKMIRQQLGDDVPIMQTIFSPLYCVQNLAGAERLHADMRAHPDAVHRALKSLTETMARFAEASLRAGADSIFFATQMATRKQFSEDDFRAFGEAYDVQVIQAIRAAKADFILLHIHGFDIYFERLARWDVDMLNWHDRRTAPSLKQARAMLRHSDSWSDKESRSTPGEILRSAHASRDKVIVGGLNEWDTLAKRSREQVIAEARDALMQAAGRGFVLGAGCVIPVDTPEENIRAVIEAVR